MSGRIPANNIKLKRAYEKPADTDGTRILIDRLWPRGMSKEDAALNEWIKELAPSTDLRNWFGHAPERWEEFEERYADEIRQHPDQIKKLRAMARNGTITLVYAARDEKHNNAIVLKDLLLGKRKTKNTPDR